jgi:hypothetical protein
VEKSYGSSLVNYRGDPVRSSRSRGSQPHNEENKVMDLKYIPAAVVAIGLLGFSGAPIAVQAQPAGEWTRCVAWNGGHTYNIVNGSVSQARCFQLRGVCTGNPNAVATYYTPAVIVNAPYIRCIAN